MGVRNLGLRLLRLSQHRGWVQLPKWIHGFVLARRWLLSCEGQQRVLVTFIVENLVLK